MNDEIPPREPSADIRMIASGLRQVYVALVDEGFRTKEALRIIGYMLVAQQSGEA